MSRHIWPSFNPPGWGIPSSKDRTATKRELPHKWAGTQVVLYSPNWSPCCCLCAAIAQGTSGSSSCAVIVFPIPAEILPQFYVERKHKWRSTGRWKSSDHLSPFTHSTTSARRPKQHLTCGSQAGNPHASIISGPVLPSFDKVKSYPDWKINPWGLAQTCLPLQKL